MILVLDDALWAELRAAHKALKEAPTEVGRPSRFHTPMARVGAIARAVRATQAATAALRPPTAVDRPALFAAADALRAREATKGPKPRIRDPLTER